MLHGCPIMSRACRRTNDKRCMDGAWRRAGALDCRSPGVFALPYTPTPRLHSMSTRASSSLVQRTNWCWCCWVTPTLIGYHWIGWTKCRPTLVCWVLDIGYYIISLALSSVLVKISKYQPDYHSIIWSQDEAVMSWWDTYGCTVAVYCINMWSIVWSKSGGKKS